MRWFASYLSKRHQAGRDESDSLPDFTFTFTGVPQSNVLGPLLFIIFIMDLSRTLKYSKYGIFADDARIFFHCDPTDLANGIRKLNHDAAQVFCLA